MIFNAVALAVVSTVHYRVENLIRWNTTLVGEFNEFNSYLYPKGLSFNLASSTSRMILCILFRT